MEPPPQRITNPTAVFEGLDKITGRITSFNVAINETVQFGALQVTPKACYSRPPTETPQTDAFVDVDEVTLKGNIKRIFTGWMFKASPGLHAVEHPIYDVWLIDCKGGKGPDVADASDSTGGEQARRAGAERQAGQARSTATGRAAPASLGAVARLPAGDPIVVHSDICIPLLQAPEQMSNSLHRSLRLVAPLDHRQRFRAPDRPVHRQRGEVAFAVERVFQQAVIIAAWALRARRRSSGDRSRIGCRAGCSRRP